MMSDILEGKKMSGNSEGNVDFEVCHGHGGFLGQVRKFALLLLYQEYCKVWSYLAFSMNMQSSRKPSVVFPGKQMHLSHPQHLANSENRRGCGCLGLALGKY